MLSILGKLAAATLAASLSCAGLTGCDDSSMIHVFDAASAEEAPATQQINQ